MWIFSWIRHLHNIPDTDLSNSLFSLNFLYFSVETGFQ